VRKLFAFDYYQKRRDCYARFMARYMLIDNTLCLDLTCTSSKRRTKDDFNPTALLCAIAKHFLRHSKQGAARDSQLEAH